MTELGIVDIREVHRVIKSSFDYDFSNYALTSFKQRLERVMSLHILGSVEDLVKKLEREPDFFDSFLHEMTVPSTEMFRDPSHWRWLREEFFPKQLDKSTGPYKIWLPSCVSGGELYSLAILLHESGISDKVQIVASSFSDISIKTIIEGIYDQKKMEISAENYKRFNGIREMSHYFKTENDCIIRDSRLIEKVEFIKLNINFDKAPQKVRLILYRNNLIYFNPSRQEQILQLLHGSLSATGCLILGTRERISALGTASKEFESVNETESVYRRRNLI
jgi:chemotaxis protein methyltransferase CheR